MFSCILRHIEERRGWRALATAFGLGLLSALALPPVHAVPVLLLSIPGLLVLVGAAASWRRAALLGLFWGWGHFAGGLYWITHAVLTEVEKFWWLVPIAVPALSLPLGLFVALPAALAWAVRPGWPRLLAFSGAWVLSELLRGVLLTGFPWNLIGTVWAFDALPVQAAAWIGVHGLSLATVLLAGLPLLGRRALAGGALAVLGFALFGFLRLTWVAEPEPRPVQLVLVQGNVAQELKWREETRFLVFRRYLAMTRQGVAQAAAELPPGGRVVVIWPETASPFLLNEDPDARRLIAEVLPENAILLSGSVRAEFEPGGRRARRVFNSLVAVDPAGRVAGVYDKAHLVPFGEYMPLRGLLPVRLVHGGMDFSAGPGLLPLAPAGVPAFGTLICYEVIFPGHVTPAPRPEWLVNVTNDAWFGISAGPYQHLAAARLRAVEEGLPLARAAQTGVSAVFDSRGREVARIPLGETGVLTAPLPVPLPPTPFARLGLWIPGAFAAALLAAGWWAGRMRRVPSGRSAIDSRQSV